MDKLLAKLNQWIKVIQAALLWTIILEAILIVIIGIASNNVTTSKYWLGILIGCGLVYTLLMVIKGAYQYKFPSSIVDELIATRQLEEKNKLFDRQKAINEYINSAIQGLNAQTCSIDSTRDGDDLCDKELRSSLMELLQPIVSYTDVILDTSTEKKFTIGIYIDGYYKFPNSYEEVELDGVGIATTVKDPEPITDKGILILGDELGLETDGILPKELIDEQKISGAPYEIQTAIKRTLNNLAFNNQEFDFDNKKYSIICAEIFEPCSDNYADGVLFIIHRNTIAFPEDLSEVLAIFNRITANFLSKYNSCILAKIISKKRGGNTTV